MGVPVFDQCYHEKMRFRRLADHEMRKICLTGMLILILINHAFATDKSGQFLALRIAHAGGGLGKVTYTNSYQALEANLQNGFRYFEIDFSFTSDGQLVCLHDWKANFVRTFGFDTERPLSFEKFKQLAGDNPRFTNCTLEGLDGWMREHPATHVVTDVRGDNLEALKLILTKLPDAEKRVIPQIYDPQRFDAVKDMGFEQMIWTLYRYRGSNYRVIQWVDQWQDNRIAITMPRDRASTALPSALKEKGIPTYVHTINDSDEMDRFLNQFGVTEIYTDFLVP
jgi:glycerophosphoryl diester phosphodiesterase